MLLLMMLMMKPNVNMVNSSSQSEITDCMEQSPISHVSDHMALMGIQATRDSKVYGANMGPTWGRHDPGGPHVGPMNFAIWGTM